MDEYELEEYTRNWSNLLLESIRSGSWGQNLESTKNYREIVDQVTKFIKHYAIIRTEDVIFLNNLRVVMETVLMNPEADISMAQLRLVHDAMGGLFKGSAKFPFSVEAFADEVIVPAFINPDTYSGGRLLPPPVLKFGRTFMSIQIISMGIKDAKNYINPYMTISVADATGALVGDSQDTPHGTYKAPNHVEFGHRVFFPLSIEEMQERDMSIFFEFAHYKPKGYNSVRCWSLLETDELKPGPSVMQIYKKIGPKKGADFTKKKIWLFSVKHLHLNVNISFSSL
eukprot:TRINITY_DN776155_c0_g1_i1.p1 TRINITY_DN776155_c0_g1~~TRINITY_DN776155_c0_g1_i1.p1  ORF type:complete len:295 (-),score=54.50 TRINITY_DN776155_c0_g1_i1:73-924(-)